MAKNVVRGYINQEKWSELVDKCRTLEAYKTIVNAMFSDGKFTKSRIIVLQQYTQDVCECLNHKESTDINYFYNKFKNDIEKHHWYNFMLHIVCRTGLWTLQLLYQL